MWVGASRRLARIALKGTGFETLDGLFKGPTAVAYSKDPVAAAKVVQLKHFVATAPLEGSFIDRVHAVASLDPDVVWDVVDPAGGEVILLRFTPKGEQA